MKQRYTALVSQFIVKTVKRIITSLSSIVGTMCLQVGDCIISHKILVKKLKIIALVAIQIGKQIIGHLIIH